jgi:hypothetical protein
MVVLGVGDRCFESMIDSLKRDGCAQGIGDGFSEKWVMAVLKGLVMDSLKRDW